MRTPCVAHPRGAVRGRGASPGAGRGGGRRGGGAWRTPGAVRTPASRLGVPVLFRALRVGAGVLRPAVGTRARRAPPWDVLARSGSRGSGRRAPSCDRRVRPLGLPASRVPGTRGAARRRPTRLRRRGARGGESPTHDPAALCPGRKGGAAFRQTWSFPYDDRGGARASAWVCAAITGGLCSIAVSKRWRQRGAFPTAGVAGVGARVSRGAR